MIITQPTEANIKEWKQLFKPYHSNLSFNRKTGKEVDAYFRKHYVYELLNSEEFCQVVEDNIILYY